MPTGLYIGSCWDMKKRLRKHRNKCYNENSEQYNYPVYKYIRENGEFHTFNMKVIDSGECEDRTELHCGEQFYIDMAGGIENLLNDRDAFVLPEEYKKRQAIITKNNKKKNIETKRYSCELCGVYFQEVKDLQRHYTSKKHITKVKTDSRTLE